MLTSKCALRHNAVHFFDISTSKSAPRPPVFNTFDFQITLLTSKCASRHNGVHFFNISTSKSAPRPPVFNTFDFQMCFAPQRRALFQHLNFQKWSDPEVFCTFSLRNQLRATTACNFSSLIFPDVSAPAALASLLFNPPEPQNHEKNSVSRLSYLFAHLHLLSSDLFSSDSSPCWLLFHLSILSEVWLLNFLRILFSPMRSSAAIKLDVFMSAQLSISTSVCNIFCIHWFRPSFSLLKLQEIGVTHFQTHPNIIWLVHSFSWFPIIVPCIWLSISNSSTWI